MTYAREFDWVTGLAAGSVDENIYFALRQIFVDRTQVQETFDFASFVELSIEEDFSTVVKLDYIMILITTGVILAPAWLHIQLWLPAFFLLVIRPATPKVPNPKRRSAKPH